MSLSRLDASIRVEGSHSGSADPDGWRTPVPAEPRL